MIGILVVSHSAKLAEGIVELAEQMNHGQTIILPAGGLESNEIGTNPLYIKQRLEELAACRHILVFVDLGSAILSTDSALELVDAPLKNKVTLVDAPIVEATVAAVIQAGISDDVAEIIHTAIAAKELQKL